MSYRDSNIVRYCELIENINECVKFLDKQKKTMHYDGGRSFEEINAEHIKELKEWENELRSIIIKITPETSNK